MVLYSELIVWIIRTSLFSFWFTGIITDGLLEVNTKGIIQGFIPKYMSLILVGLVANFAINGLPRLIHKKKSCDDLIIVGEFKAGTLGTVSFLLQGSKVKRVTRSLVQLTGRKNVFITNDRTTLFINNAENLRKLDYIIILLHLILSFLLLLSSPFLMVSIFVIVKYLLVLIHVTPGITGSLVKILTMVVFGYYFYPYFILSSRYSLSSIRYVTKPLGKYYGYSTVSSPLLAFINSKNQLLMGAADSKKIIHINAEYIDDNINLYNYIVAHEAGHLNDKFLNLIRACLVPILYPWLVFIMLSLGVYFNANDNVLFGNSFTIVGLTTIILTTLTSFNLQKLREYRADEYAARKLGITNLKRILQELSFVEDGKEIPLSGKVSFSKRLERIMRKKWEN